MNKIEIISTVCGALALIFFIAPFVIKLFINMFYKFPERVSERVMPIAFISIGLSLFLAAVSFLAKIPIEEFNSDSLREAMITASIYAIVLILVSRRNRE